MKVKKKNIYILKMILYQRVGRYLAKGNILIILKGAMYNRSYSCTVLIDY